MFFSVTGMIPTQRLSKTGLSTIYLIRSSWTASPLLIIPPVSFMQLSPASGVIIFSAISCAAGPAAKAAAVVGKIAVVGKAARVTGRARQGGRRSRNRGGTRRRCRCWTRCRRRRRTRSWCSRGNDGVVRAAVVLSSIHQAAVAGSKQGHDNKKNHDNTDNAAKTAASLPVALFTQQQVGKCCQKEAVSAGAGRIDRCSFPIVVRSVRAAAARAGSAGRSGTSALGIAARPPGISSRAR